MKRLKHILAGAALLALAGALCAYPQSPGSAQAEGAPRRLQVVAGPRVGLTWIVADPAAFNAAVQSVFPDRERDYSPVIMQFGVNFEQRIRIGGTRSHFALQEVLLLGGLEQNIILPSLSFLIGFRSGAGLEFGLGPNLSTRHSNPGEAGIGVSVVYAVGWTFAFGGVYVPLNLAVVPTPSDGIPRISLLTGFNFGQGR